VALGRGTLSHQDYPEKGDLVFRLFSLNRLSKRDLCPFKEVFQNTRKKVTFIGIEAGKKNIRKSLRKNEDENSEPSFGIVLFWYSKKSPRSFAAK
jgi:hypothetical protein